VLQRWSFTTKTCLGISVIWEASTSFTAQEVLHHTPDPRGAFLNLAGRLHERGEIAIMSTN